LNSRLSGISLAYCGSDSAELLGLILAAREAKIRLAVVHPWRLAAYAPFLGKAWKHSCRFLKSGRSSACLALSSSGSSSKAASFTEIPWDSLEKRFGSRDFGLPWIVSCYPASSFANISILLNSAFSGRR